MKKKVYVEEVCRIKGLTLYKPVTDEPKVVKDTAKAIDETITKKEANNEHIKKMDL